MSMRTTNARMRRLLAEYDSEYGHVCLVNKRLFSLMTTNENLVNEFIQIKHREMRAICTLKPGRTTVAGPKYYTSRSSAICHLLSFKTEFDSNEYHVVKASPLGPCMKITIPDWKNSTKGLTVPFNLVGWLKVDLNHREWPKTILLSFSFVFIAVFQYYSLAFLCLFYPTEILQDGVTHIILEGASPVSLRSFAGNYFFSGKEGIWCKAKTFILRVFIIPLPFIVSATAFADFERDGLFKISSYIRLFIVSGICYCFQAFYISFFSKRSLKAKPCSFVSFSSQKPFLVKTNFLG